MPIKLFPLEQVRELLWDEVPGLKKIRDDHSGSSRWSEYRAMVFQDESDGKFYLASYTRGLTESQDEAPFEYSDDPIKCVEVEPVEKTIISYEPVEG